MSNKKSEYDLVQSMALAPYRLLGNRINFWLRLFGNLDKQLLKGNVKVAFPAYVALILVFSSLGGISIFALTLVLCLVFGATLLVSLLLSTGVGVSCGLVIFLVLYFYPAMQVGNRKRVLDNKQVVSKCGWTPYHGREITGDVVLTMVRGKVVMKEGEILGEAGWGKWVTRSMNTKNT